MLPFIVSYFLIFNIQHIYYLYMFALYNERKAQRWGATPRIVVLVLQFIAALRAAILFFIVLTYNN